MKLTVIVLMAVVLLIGCITPQPLKLGGYAEAPDEASNIHYKTLDSCNKSVLKAALVFIGRIKETSSDYGTCGKIECWLHPSAALRNGKIKGDCDETAIALSEVLRSLGLPAELLLVKTHRGVYHLTTYCGGWVLDLNEGKVTTVQRAQYTPIKISAGIYNLQWRAVKGVRQ